MAAPVFPKRPATSGGEPSMGNGLHWGIPFSVSFCPNLVDVDAAAAYFASSVAGAGDEALKLLSKDGIGLSEKPAARAWLTRDASSDADVPGLGQLETGLL